MKDRGRPHWWVAAVLASLAGAAVARVAGQATFRASVDLVAVDVLVVDKDGRPVSTLGPDKFEVSIDGKRRRVVSADFVRNSASDVAIKPMASTGSPTGGPVATNIWPTPPSLVPALPGRVFVLAVDASSFSISDLPSVIASARGFLSALQPNDLAGLFVFPVGARIDPTTDHRLISQQLDVITGTHESLHSEFHLTSSEIIDINAELAQAGLRSTVDTLRGQVAASQLDTPTMLRVQSRECGEGTNTNCTAQIATEAMSMGAYLEGQVVDSMNQLRSLLRSLAATSSRKTVVVLSAGMPVSDRPGGRPDIGNLATELGRDAAETDTTIYAVHVDAGFFTRFSAETSKIDKLPLNRERDTTVGWQLLDRFAGASGGTLLRVLVGNGEQAFDRVLNETSAYYLLGVEPVDADRDGRTRELKVKVNQSGVTVRSRTWVALPKKT